MLTRRGVLIEEMGQTYLAEPDTDADGEAARDLQQRIVEIGAKVPGHETIDRLVEVGNMARTEYSLGDHCAAERALAQMRPALERHVGNRHDRSIVFRSLHAQVLAELGRYDDAVREQMANLDEVRARGTPDDEQIALQAATLAKVLRFAGRTAEALPLAKEALAYFERKYLEPTWYRERVRWVLGELLMADGRVSEGASMVETALSALEKMLAAQPHHPVRPEGWLVLAVARRSDAASEPLAERACTAYERAGMQGAPQHVRCQALRAWLAAVKPGAPTDALAEFKVARDQLWPLAAAGPRLARRVGGGGGRDRGPRPCACIAGCGQSPLGPGTRGLSIAARTADARADGHRALTGRYSGGGGFLRLAPYSRVSILTRRPA